MAPGTEGLQPGTVLAVGDGGKWEEYAPQPARKAAGILLGAVIDGEAVVICRDAEVLRNGLQGLDDDALASLAARCIDVF